MADLTPRTREENFLNGEDLEPITRREHFYAGRENELPEGHQEPETREEWFIQKYREAGDVTVESLSVTENGTYTAPSGKAYSPVSVNVPLPENAYLLQTIEHEQVATFSDGTDNFVKSLEVAIEPQQDLHGYDAPWVGGSRKNKMPPLGNMSNNGITMTTDINGNTTFNGTVESGVIFDAYVDLPSALTGNYVLSINNSQTIAGLYQNTFIALFNGSTRTHAVLMNEQNTKIVVTNGTITRFMIRFQAGVTVTNFKISVQLEEGNTATTYEPYSNVCPISGWNEVNVTRCGKNLFDVSKVVNLALGDIILHGDWYRGWYIPIENGEIFTISRKNISAPNRFRICFTTELPADGVPYYNEMGAEEAYIDADNLTQKTVTVPNDRNYKYMFIYLSNANETITDAMEIQIEVGDTPTTYEPYNGQPYTIDLDGTRYGGKLDVVNGVLTLTHGFISSYNGETLPSTWISDRDLYAEGTTPTIGAEVCYKLATPQTIQLSPTIVKSLQGENIFFASTGEIEWMQYWGKEVS